MELTDRQLPFELKIYMDEAGRGPLAGPVAVGTVIQTSPDLDKSQFADSKKLSKKKREAIYETMRRDALLARPHTDDLARPHTDDLARPHTDDLVRLQPRPQSGSLLPHSPTLVFSVGFASACEIDEYGIIGSLQMASMRSLFQTMYSFYEHILRSKLEESVWGEDHIFRIVMDNELSNLEQDARRFGKISEDSTTKGIFGNHSSSSDILPEKLDLPLQQLQFLRLFFHTPQRQFAYKGLYIDGNHTFGLDQLLGLKVQTIIKGDARNPMIGAASIAAKVERDSYMKQINGDYPEWGFAKHKGYGTKEHRENIIHHSKGTQTLRQSGMGKRKGRTQEHDYGKLDPSLRSGGHIEGGQVALTPEHRITFLSRIYSGESHK